MVEVRDAAEFRCGLYAVAFAAPDDALAFATRYRACPNWPVIAAGPGANQVVVVALELRRQCHGDFSQEHNTLAAHPEYLGARSVHFRRDDTLLALFPEHTLVTGTAEAPPCGSNCPTCPMHQAPCQGCPATWEVLP